jgi:predicted lipase
MDELGYDIISAKYVSELNRPAYFIALSKNNDEIMIVIRGTSTLEDALTDLVSAPELLLPGDERMYTGHRGMVLAAQYLYKDTGPLIRALMNSKARYKISIVGHSLGAGTASLLGCLMHFHESWFDPERVKCWAYSPPSVGDRELAELSKSVCLS